jgi:hypothetical protein
MSWKKWNRIVAGVILTGLFLVCSAAELLLYRFNENLDTRAAIAVQLKEDSLYGRLLSGQDFAYKRQMTSAWNPELLVIGSSRVMVFRKEFFSDAVRFYNAGGSVPTLEKGMEFLEQLPKEYRPRGILLGLDLWWVNGNYVDHRDIKADIDGGNFVSSRVRLYGTLFDHLLKRTFGKIGVSVFDSRSFQAAPDPVEGKRSIGLLAAIRGDGFRNDGSWQYGSVVRGEIIGDKDFADTKEAIRTGRGAFTYAERVDPQKVEKLRTFLRQLKTRTNTITAFAPPYAHEIYAMMEKMPQYAAYLKEARSILATLCREEGIGFYDFSDVTWYGSNDDETLDGYHGSERSYARLTLAMEQDPALGKYIDGARIRRMLNETSNPRMIVPSVIREKK